MAAVRSAKSRLMFATVLAAGGVLANSLEMDALAAENETPAQSTRDYIVKREVHGKPSIALHEQFTIPVKGGASGVAWSPDGSVLAVASGTVLATYTSSGHYLSEFDSHSMRSPLLLSVAFVNGRKQVLFPVNDNDQRDAALDVRDVTTGEIVKTLVGESAAGEFSVSHDQKRVALASYLGKKIVTYDTRTWQPLSTLITAYPKNAAVSLAFFPDNKRLAVGMGGWKSDKHVAIVDSTSGKTLKEFQPNDPKVDEGSVSGIAVSPQGDLLLIGMSSRMIRILRVNDGTQVAALTDPGTGIRQGQAVWDPKGRFVAVVDGDGLIVWQPQIPGENFIKIRFSSPPKTFYAFDAERFVTMDVTAGYFVTLAITRAGKALAVTHGDSVTVFNIE